MNLKAFMKFPSPRYNAHVKEKGFETLYLRKGDRYLPALVPSTANRGIEKVSLVLDIASVSANHPGSGAFSALLLRIKTDYPFYTIYVENVLQTRFADYLIRKGFIVTNHHDPVTPCFYLRATSPLL